MLVLWIDDPCIFRSRQPHEGKGRRGLRIRTCDERHEPAVAVCFGRQNMLCAPFCTLNVSRTEEKGK